MGIRQKRWSIGLRLFAVSAVIFSSVGLSALSLSSTAQADGEYQPTKDNGTKCDDGSAPTTTLASVPACTADTRVATPDDENGSGNADENNKSTNCAIDNIGWILCPIINGAAKISDKAFDILADNFLRTDPSLVSDASGTKQAWEIARNLANIMFIIAFLAIIVSQVTSMGINNYGIKKMTPKLIVAAILVNVSYYICQLAVDVTNILGYEIQNALVDISNSLGPSVFGDVTKFAGTEHSTTPGTILTVIAGGILASTAFAFGGVGMLISVGLFILITVVTVVIILMLRKALIVLLVVISPIAFVLYILPNTEKLFSKWLHMFWQLLMVFPVVGLLFGAGQLASTIILVSGAQTQSQAEASEACNPENKDEKLAYNKGTDTDGKALSSGEKANPNSIPSCGAGSVVISGSRDGENSGKSGEKAIATWTLGLVAAGVAVAPLLAVWAVLKGALSAAGAIGGKIAANVQKGTDKGARSGAKAVADKYKASAYGQMRARDAKLREIDIKAGTYEGRRPDRRLRNSLNKYLNDKDSVANKILSTGSQSGYAKQRERMANKGSNEWIAEKAQELKASGMAGDLGTPTNPGRVRELMSTLNDQTKSESERASAMDELRAHRLAVQGTALGSALDEHLSTADTTGMSKAHQTYMTGIKNNYRASEKHISDQQKGQADALAQALAPHLSTINPQAQANAARRQANNAQPGQQPGQPGAPPTPNPNGPNGNGGGQDQGGNGGTPPANP